MTLPPHQHYVEPYAGSLAILLAKRRSPMETVNDLDGECRAAVVLSGYDSPLYAELYSGWPAVRIPTTTGQGGAREERTEVLWCNRPKQPDLFDSVEV